MKTTQWKYMYPLIKQIWMQLMSPSWISTFCNTSAVTGPQFTYGNWQTYLKFQLHNSTCTWLTKMDLPTIWDQQRHEGGILFYMEALGPPRDLHRVISMVFITCISVYCFKRFWCRPATKWHWPYSPVSSQHTIVDDDDVGVVSIYRSGGTVEKPIRPPKNHDDLCTEWETMRLESHFKQPAVSKAVPSARSFASKPKSGEHN